MIEQYTSPVAVNNSQEPWLVGEGVVVSGGVAIPSLDFNFITGGLPGTVTFTRASTATYFNSAGVLTSAAINAPRFDYNPSTLAAQGLLIEEQRTNLATYSADFGNAIWSKNQSTVTTDATVAPDNTTTADKLVENTANSQHSISVISVLTTGVQYTISVFAKSAERSIILLGAVKDDGNFVGRYFNLATGVSTASFGTPDSWSISSVGNGWYRCVVTITNSATGSSDSVGVYLVDSGTNTTYTGNGTSGLFLWGAQLEAGAFPTSYIPTTTTALTRSADVASVNTLSPWFNATEGTLFAEATSTGYVLNTGFPLLATFDDGTNNNRITVSQGSSSNSLWVNLRSSAVGTTLADTNVDLSATPAKIAGGFSGTTVSVSVNGQATLSGTTNGVPSGMAGLYLGNRTLYLSALNGYLRRITYYPRRLSNAELQAITV